MLFRSPRTDFTPLPRNLNILPLCVSAGIFNFTRPSRVGTSSSPPNAASTKLIGTSQYRFEPSRWNISCSLTSICTYKSPAGPPIVPRSEEHTSELQSRPHLVCRLLLEKKNKYN